MTTDDRGAFEQFDQYIEQNLAYFNAPGLVYGLTDRTKLLREKCFGMANLDAQTPVFPHTLFEIGSISKSFTSIILLKLHERGLLDIHAPVTTYLPWFQVQSQYPAITLHHLMSHTAGIICGVDATVSAQCEAWALCDTQTGAAPGEIFHYSNSGYKVLGLVLQEILQQSMAEILRQNILAPLGMSATEPVITNEIRKRLAVGYAPFYDDRPLPRGGELAPATWFESETADGSICSTGQDMCRYMRMLLARGDGLISESSFDQLVKPIIATGDGLHGEQYGYGLSVSIIDSCWHIGHSGGMVGYVSDMLMDMQTGLGVVLLTNGPAELNELALYALRLLRAARNLGEWPTRPSTDFRIVGQTSDYIGIYRTQDSKECTISVDAERLELKTQGKSVILEPRGEDRFFANLDGMNRFLFSFGRQEGDVVEMFHGSDWYIRDDRIAHQLYPIPQDWTAYVGHYRAYDPWFSNFRIVLRKDTLVMIDPYGEENKLSPLDVGYFRVGDEQRSPERIRFSGVYGDQAHKAYFSGGEYCRCFTP